MIEFIEHAKIAYDKELLTKIKESLTDKEIELVIVDAEQMQDLNERFFNKSYPTDVLSFPLEQIPNAPLGSIVINAQKVEEGAAHYGHTPQEEFALLFIHGLLHLLGYDHEQDNGQMRQKEAQIIEAFGLPKSLIIRNES